MFENVRGAFKEEKPKESVLEKGKFAGTKSEVEKKLDIARKDAIDALMTADAFVVICADKEHTGGVLCATNVMDCVKIIGAMNKILGELEDDLSQNMPEDVKTLLKLLKETRK